MTITIGAYTLTIMANGNVWIRHESGEGGAFPEAEVEAVIAAYFAERF